MSKTERTIYRCYYEFDLALAGCYVESSRGPSVFEEGFWLNNKLELSHGFDGKYWIPPSKISYIEATNSRGD